MMFLLADSKRDIARTLTNMSTILTCGANAISMKCHGGTVLSESAAKNNILAIASLFRKLGSPLVSAHVDWRFRWLEG